MLSIFSACCFLIKNVLCSELIVCCNNMDIKIFSPKVILGYELIAKIKLIFIHSFYFWSDNVKLR